MPSRKQKYISRRFLSSHLFHATSPCCLDSKIEFAQVEKIARQTEKKLLTKVELFDVYEGKNLPEGKKSYAVNFVFTDPEKTMNDRQIEAIMTKLILNLKKELNCELR